MNTPWRNEKPDGVTNKLVLIFTLRSVVIASSVIRLGSVVPFSSDLPRFAVPCLP